MGRAKNILIIITLGIIALCVSFCHVPDAFDPETEKYSRATEMESGTSTEGLIMSSTSTSEILDTTTVITSSSSAESSTLENTTGSTTLASTTLESTSTENSSVESSEENISNIPPKTEKKDSSYFSTAIFIGDSRVEGLMLYGSLYDADYIYEKGLSIFKYFEHEFPINGKKQTAAAYMESKAGAFKDIYIALGLNESGYPLDSFISRYRKLVEHIKKHHADANIYVHALLPVAASLDSHSYINNKNLQKFNAALAKLSLDLGVFYIDPSPSLVDENGAIPEGVSYDGIHYDKVYVDKWQEYLQTHVAQ